MQRPRRKPWKRYLLILALTMLALVRAEATAARMEGRPDPPGRILRLVQEADGLRLCLMGWEWRTEGALALWEQIRSWRASIPWP